jgi:hypothetical protein
VNFRSPFVRTTLAVAAAIVIAAPAAAQLSAPQSRTVPLEERHHSGAKGNVTLTSHGKATTIDVLMPSKPTVPSSSPCTREPIAPTSWDRPPVRFS